MKNIVAKKKALISNKVLILEGMTRVGKFFLGKIISNLENTEYYQYLTTLENLPIILKGGGISEDAATALIQLIIDESFYYRGLGRNINLRYDDASSIYHSLELNEYLKRSLTPYSNDLKSEILRNGDTRSALFILPDTFPLIDIFFKAYPNLKLIKEIRHPIDFIYSCIKNGMGWRHETDPIAFNLVFENDSAPIPWYAIDWKEEYLSLPDVDRVIKSIDYLHKLEIEVYNSMTPEQKQSIHVVRYEDLVERTNKTIEMMSKFLEKKPMEGMQTVLARERVPKIIDLGERDKKNLFIKENASNKYFNIYTDMVDEYNEEKFDELEKIRTIEQQIG
jgi:hypothetical protein